MVTLFRREREVYRDNERRYGVVDAGVFVEKRETKTRCKRLQAQEETQMVNY